MAEDIVSGLFGLTPFQTQQQQNQAFDTGAERYAQLDPFQRAAATMYRAGGGVANIGAGMLGMQNNTAVAEAQRRQAELQGLDISSPESILAKAATVQDPQLKMRLTMLAQKVKDEQQKALIEQRKQILSERKQEFQEQDAMDLKRQALQQQYDLAKQRAEDQRNSAADRVAAMREANATRLQIAQMTNAMRQSGAEQKKAGMSANTEKEILKADEAAMGAESGVAALKQALEINNKAMGFKGAGLVADIGSVLPDALRPQTFDTTLELDNVIQNSVLPQLKAVFGANPTEGERKIMLDVAGSSSKPAKVREGIFNRALEASKNRAKFNSEKAQKLRAGEYFQAPATAPAPSVATPAKAVSFGSLK